MERLRRSNAEAGVQKNPEVMASGFIYFEQTIPETLRRKKKQAGKQEKAVHG
jgi:hypothetical protein